MCRRRQIRPLAWLLLLAQLWLGGIAVAFHASFHASEQASAAPAISVAGDHAGHHGLLAHRWSDAAPCPVCTYLKAVRGAAPTASAPSSLPPVCLAAIPPPVCFLPQVAPLLLRGRGPPTL